MTDKPFRVVCTLVLAVAVIGVLASCTSRQTRTDPERSSDVSAHITPEPRDMSDVMHAKLAYIQAVVEGIAVGNLGQVERNAQMLTALSERSSWMVHDTVTYITMSEQFREIARDLERHAAARDVDRTVDSYSAMVQSCVACHDYLRRERLIRPMPGEVTLAK